MSQYDYDATNPLATITPAPRSRSRIGRKARDDQRKRTQPAEPTPRPGSYVITPGAGDAYPPTPDLAAPPVAPGIRAERVTSAHGAGPARTDIGNAIERIEHDGRTEYRTAQGSATFEGARKPGGTLDIVSGPAHMAGGTGGFAALASPRKPAAPGSGGTGGGGGAAQQPSVDAQGRPLYDRHGNSRAQTLRYQDALTQMRSEADQDAERADLEALRAGSGQYRTMPTGQRRQLLTQQQNAQAQNQQAQAARAADEAALQRQIAQQQFDNQIAREQLEVDRTRAQRPEGRQYATPYQQQMAQFYGDQLTAPGVEQQSVLANTRDYGAFLRNELNMGPPPAAQPAQPGQPGQPGQPANPLAQPTEAQIATYAAQQGMTVEQVKAMLASQAGAEQSAAQPTEAQIATYAAQQGMTVEQVKALMAQEAGAA